MSEMKFILPGSETLNIAGQTADLLINKGDGNAALLYLFVLRTHGQRSASDAALALGKTHEEIINAMKVLGILRLIHYDENQKTEPAQSANAVRAGQPPKNITQPQKQAAPAASVFTEETVEPPVLTKPAPKVISENDKPHETENPSEAEDEISAEKGKTYTINDIRREMNSGSAFTALVDMVQQSLGKIMSPIELAVIFGIYDSLRMPPEVILHLITYCVEDTRRSNTGRHMPTMKFIEKTAYKWAREGILTLEKAESHIKEMDRRRLVQTDIKRALHIKDRELTPTEKVFIEGWVEMGFNADAIDLAYDRTIINTGRLTWGYMDSILKNWHNKGMHTVEEIVSRDSKRAVTATSLLQPQNNKPAPNAEELEQMKKLLRMIKED